MWPVTVGHAVSGLLRRTTVSEVPPREGKHFWLRDEAAHEATKMPYPC